MDTSQKRFNNAHMRAAEAYGALSHCKRRQVGALLVSNDNRPLLAGYNGTSKGRDNCCEGEDGQTKNIVHHAEENLIGYAAKLGIPTAGNVMYITTSPCINCAKLIEVAGISRVVYRDFYKSDEGIKYLEEAGIVVEHYKGE